MVKNPSANAEDARIMISIPGLERSSGVGNGNSFQYSCLENPMDRKVWWTAVRGVARAGRELAMEHECSYQDNPNH